MVVETRRYGAKQNEPGVVLYEQPSANQVFDPLYGTMFGLGVLRRGPMGVPVAVSNKRQYLEIFGDRQNLNWHLFPNSAHLLPDFVDDYFSNSSGAGKLFLIRLDLDGKARRSELILKSRMGAPVLKIKAANEGRWGGAKTSIPLAPIVVATARTFTILAPGALANEFVDAEVEFSNISGQRIRVISNREADPVSGETVFTVGAQYNLITLGVTGPVSLSGTAAYTPRIDITGSVAFPLYRPLTGACNINGKTVTGVGTAFMTEVEVGHNIYMSGEARSIESITSSTTLTVGFAFSTEGSDITLQADNLEVTGTGTAFTSDLAVGDKLFAEVDGVVEVRAIAAISTSTSLKLSSGFSDVLPPGTVAQRDNLTITGTGTSFVTQLQVGSYLIDPNRAGNLVRVTSITSGTSVQVDRPFTRSFGSAQLTKQSQKAAVMHNPSRNEGLSVSVVQGQKKPSTHFGLIIYFNGVEVLSISDASLDPSDEFFVEQVVNQANLVYTSGNKNYNSFITAESLWTSDYTTNPESDVRPSNGAGEILELSESKLYTIADLEYDYLVGESVYPNPYEFPRSFFRIQSGIAPKTLQGTISSNGTIVTGTSTTFRAELKAGDYLYAPNSNTLRKVRAITSDTALSLETAFPINVPALTRSKRAGYIQVNEAYDLKQQAEIGNRFFVVNPQPLERGYDGNSAQILPFQFTKFLDPDINTIGKAVEDGNLGLVRIACPGISDVAIQKAGAAFAERMPGEFRCEIPSYITSASAAESFVLQQLGRSDYITVAFPSYGYKANPVAVGYRLVSLSGLICGGESRRALANKGWAFPYAGTEATLPGILRLTAILDSSDKEILNSAGIHPIHFQDGNAIVFGARSPALSETYTFTHIRRITSHYIRVLNDARALKAMLFLPNQPGLADQLVLLLEQFARREYDNKVLTNYLGFRAAVEIDSSFVEDTINSADAINSLVSIINGELAITFFFTPTGITEQIKVYTGPSILVERYGKTNQGSNGRR